MIRFFVFIIFLISVCLESALSQNVIVCYYGTWAAYRPGLGKFEVSNIDPELCTHIMYSFLGIDTTGNIISLDPYIDYSTNGGKDGLKQFSKLKQKNPNVKLLLAIGGWNEGSAKFSTVAASTTSRKNFLNSALKWMQTYNFDGIDIDWEYPNQGASVYHQADLPNFISLLSEMRTEFDKKGLLLTVAVAAQRDSISLSYEVPAMSKYCNFINIMAYDLNGAWESVTGHNAPLHKGEGETADRENVATVDMAVETWIKLGAPPNKLVLGVPFYGHSFNLQSAGSFGVRAPAVGPGLAGPYSGTPGVIAYNELCVRLQTEPWVKEYDSHAKVPYAHKGQEWMSYDDPHSISAKVEYALSQSLAGIMIWSIESDDFNNGCGGGDYPLLRTINKSLGRKTSGTSTITSASTTMSSPLISKATTTSKTTTTKASSGTPFKCQEEGNKADPLNCSSYYACVRDPSGVYTSYKMHCPPPLVWDAKESVCNFADLANCKV